TTSRNATAQASVSVTGPIKVVGNNAQSINISPNSEGRTVFQIIADRVINVGKVIVNVSALGEKFKEETEISVRPPSTLQKVSGSGSIVGGNSQRIIMPQNDFISGSLKYELIISKSPVAELSEQLRFLIQYPYGCTEQTISAAFPQLYFADLADKLKSANQNSSANSNVMEAIRRIKMRQLYNGAVTLWDGEGTEDWWTTTYATHFLLESRKAGFDVDNSLLETMLGYLANRLKTKETINYYYNRDQQKKIAPKEVSYSLYVLALASRSQVSAMNYYKSNQHLLALDGKYLLSAAYAVAGDKRSFTSFLPSSFTGEYSVQQTGGSFYSETRDEAIALNALIDVDPANKQIPLMAKHVSDRLKKEKYLNTQERAFSFLALGKLARNAAQSNVTAEIKSNGKLIGKMDGKDFRLTNAQLNSTNIEVITKGNGRLYFSWQMEGISSTGAYREEDNFIKIRRTFYDRSGMQLIKNTFKQNELIIVGITLEKAFSNDIENIVITDILPAGFEIENPRTKELPGMDWIKEAAEPVSLDVRDDRIHFFVDAHYPKQVYYYAVRAVSLGNFRQGPVSADAMYNGEIHSYHGAGIVKVSGK
ncbi:MAG: alpha-2-macroglobulin family protein, partial [Bacteroidota bacterium]|nr:alpha-2-macroglobulin family protein [Bacteroidota bacterium]